MVCLKSNFLLIATIIFIQCCNKQIARDSIAINNQTDIASPDTVKNDPLSSSEMQHDEKTLVIRGILDSSGNKLINIEKPILYNRNTPQPSPNQQEGRYKALVKYVNGDSLAVHFDGLVADDSEAGQSRHGFFELQIPIEHEIISLKITDETYGRIIKEFSTNEIIIK